MSKPSLIEMLGVILLVLLAVLCVVMLVTGLFIGGPSSGSIPTPSPGTPPISQGQ